MTQQRPLSPHLQVYRPQITSVLSITHRLTGVFLSIGSALLVGWLWAAAYDIEYFNNLQHHFAQDYGMIALGLWSFAFFYHLANGIRHLMWDVGYGFELNQVTRSGVAVVTFALATTGCLWYMVLKGEL